MENEKPEGSNAPTLPNGEASSQVRRRSSSSRPAVSGEVAPPKKSGRQTAKARVRKLSSHETLFPTPEAAKAAFEKERAQNPLHRRAPTPYTSRSTLRSQRSDRSLASKVSFDSTNTRSRRSSGASRGTALLGEDSDTDLSDFTIQSPNDGTGRVALGGWDPGFGATRGIGPAGEAIEVIGLGRKTPRHRVFQRDMLKPALRGSLSIPHSTQGPRGGHGRGSGSGGGMGGAAVKPLPRRPTSMMGGVVDLIRPRHSRPSHGRHASELSTVSANSTATSTSREVRNERQRQGYHLPRQSLPPPTPTGVGPRGAPPSAFRPPQLSVLGSLFSSLSIEPRGVRDSRNAPPRLHRPLLPAESLHTYLALAQLPSWTEWPPSGPTSGQGKKGGWLGGLGGMMGRKGFEAMGQEWHRRFALAEQGRMHRVMRGWEGADKYWERRILDWCENNIPNESIPDNHRWGSQIFALPADGFQTVEFFDESSMDSGDYGLLSFLTGSLLQTAVSALHMLRFSSTSFSFHLLPAPKPPSLAYRDRQFRNRQDSNALWEGFGTLALVNQDSPTDRAMIIQVRPPDVVDGNVLREFVKDRREWWHLIPDLCVGDAGQANLLQAQVYDDCYQNQVYFFAVTNLKYWVFGHFDPTWTVAHVSPVLHRQQSEPSIMQCLVSWLVRSVDERPQAVEATHLDRLVHSPPQQPVPPYSQTHLGHNPARGTANTRSNSLQSTHSSSTSFSSLATPASPTPSDFMPWGGMPGQMANCGLPNYWDIPRSPSVTSFGGYHTWSPSHRPFSPPAYGVGMVPGNQMWYGGQANPNQYGWGMR